MDIKVAIRTLEDLADYVNEEWDHDEYQKDIDEAIDAIKIAISSLKKNKSVGTMTLNSKNYIISRVE